ncbi:MAG: malonic semialdehyde reductase [Rhodocyclaceae bacterium]|nr:malonic semialdehyde reductase [Rhodocyclaceae bacterium]
MNKALDAHALDQAFRTARTFPHYSARPVADETLRELYELAKWGPTALNSQPARFVFLRTPEAKVRLVPSLMEGNVAKVQSAPVTVIVATDTRFFDRLPTLFPAYDARPEFLADQALADGTRFRNGCLQGGYLIVAARMLGLDCGPMSGFDPAKVDAEFFPDGAWKSNFLVNLGYGDPASTFPRGPRLELEVATQFL